MQNLIDMRYVNMQVTFHEFSEKTHPVVIEGQAVALMCVDEENKPFLKHAVYRMGNFKDPETDTPIDRSNVIGYSVNVYDSKVVDYLMGNQAAPEEMKEVTGPTLLGYLS